jgi:hypothetical protein
MMLRGEDNFLRPLGRLLLATVSEVEDIEVLPIEEVYKELKPENIGLLGETIEKIIYTFTDYKAPEDTEEKSLDKTKDYQTAQTNNRSEYFRMLSTVINGFSDPEEISVKKIERQ